MGSNDNTPKNEYIGLNLHALRHGHRLKKMCKQTEGKKNAIHYGSA